jgi:hypothetical protein
MFTKFGIFNMKKIMTVLLLGGLVGCTSVASDYSVSSDTSKLNIQPITSNKSFKNYALKHDVAIASDSSGDIFLLLPDDFDKSFVFTSIKFVEAEQKCEFNILTPVAVDGAAVNSVKVASRLEFEKCHPKFKGYSLITTKTNVKFFGKASSSEAVGAYIQWKNKGIVREKLIATPVYFVGQ